MSVPPFAPKTPLSRRFRALLAVNRFLVRTGALPSTDRVSSLPMAQRLGMKPPTWALPKSIGRPDVLDRIVPGRHGDIPVRVYRPVGRPAAPVALLYVHGGGFSVGGLDSLDWFCRELSRRGGHVVVSVEYRLAPEARYPIPLDDVTDALAWLADHREELGAERIAVAGDSAGGNLAAAACLRARSEGPDVCAQVLIYPALDATLSSPSIADVPGGLSRADIAGSYANYLGDQDPMPLAASPLLEPDKSGLPTTLVITAEHDLLRDEGRLYAEALERAGVRARWLQYPGVDHAFLSLPTFAAQACQDATEQVLAELR
jgi:acetyl esterase